MASASRDDRRPGRDWFRFCRICLEWLHPRQDLDPEPWVRLVVERAQSLSIDTLAFDLYHGGHAVFDGSVAPKDRHIGDADLFALLDAELHRRGMHFVVMHMATHCNNYAGGEYPQWAQRDAQGNPVRWGASLMPCLNSPWTSFFMQELRGVLSRYRIDGAYIEGIVQGACFCDYCQTEFSKRYGRELPRDPGALASSQDCREFQMAITTNYVRRVRQVIDDVSPETIWIPCPSVYDAEGIYTDLAAWGEYADAVELERPWGHNRIIIPLWEIGMSMQVVRAESGRPAFGTLFLGWNVDLDHSPSTAAHYRHNFSEILLYGGTPQLHAQTIFDLDRSEMGTVREMYDFEEKVRPFLMDAQQIPYAALAFDRADCPGEWFKGYYRALIEAHVPFRVIPKRDLSLSLLSDHKVLLLPNIVTLSDAQLQEIQAFVAGGGGLVSTYRTGFAHPDGSLRAEHPLLALAGCSRPLGVTTRPPAHISSEQAFEQQNLRNYYRVTNGNNIGAAWVGRLQSFEGSFVEVAAAEGKVVAQALDYDYTKSFHRHHPVMGWYPGEGSAPLVILNQPAGRVVYFAGEFDAAALREGMPGVLDLLVEAALWAGGLPPIKAQCPPTVEMVTHYSPGEHAYTILLVNQTTNQLHPEWIVRYVQPIHDIRIQLQVGSARVKDVRTLADGSVQWQHSGTTVSIELARLNEYQGVVIQLAQN